MNLIRILETDDWAVDYEVESKRYRVTYFEDGHFVDDVWFDAYEEKECLVRCKDCALKHHSESNNLWCDVFEKIIPEDGYCCFGENNIDPIEINPEIIDKLNSIGCTSFLIDKINVVDQSRNTIAATDFTNESKNLVVWKALGLQEEDFYK